MMMASKFTIALLAGALVLPAAGIAEERADVTPKSADFAMHKLKIVAPAECKTQGKKNSDAAIEKRRKVHADKALVAGEEKVVNHKEAARKHSNYAADRDHGKQ